MSDKKKFSIDSIFMTTLILFLICVIITLALAGTNYATKDTIAALEEKSQNEAKQVVLKAFDHKETELKYTDKNGAEVTVVYDTAVTESGEILGYVFTTSQKGYGGEIKVMTGIDVDGKITAVKILSASDETPGLGANVTKSNFYSQFKGITKGFELVKNSKTAENQVVAVTGATISSTAVKGAVDQAFELFALIPKEEPQEESSQTEESSAEESATESEEEE